jgi:hypothetical protein
MSLCPVEDCGRRSRSGRQPLCGTHYERLRTTGSVYLAVREPRVCSAPGCDRPHLSRGLCMTHYQRQTRLGQLDLPTRPSLEDRLWSRVTKTDTCWLWTGSCTTAGYGTVGRGSDEWFYVHRLAYELLVGPIPDGLTIDHLCRVRHCVRPDHLEPVTRAENTRRELQVRYGALA